MKKKILVFNGYYFPSKNYGGPITSLVNIINSLHDKFEFYIVAYNHDFNEFNRFNIKTDKWIEVNNAKVIYIEDKLYNYNFKNIANLIKNVNPDLINLVGIFSTEIRFCVLKYANKEKLPILISPRGEVFKETLKMKAYKKIPFRIFTIVFRIYSKSFFHATTIDEKKGLMKYFNIKESKIYIAPNISIKQIGNINHQKLKDSKKINIIFISRIQRKKNLKYAIKLINNLYYDINFDIYGPIEEKDYFDECMQEINIKNKKIHINYKGVLDPSEVQNIFNKYHLFLFPTLSENYGHVILESLINNCPVLLSKNTTPWDEMGEYNNSVFNLKDFDSYKNRLIEIVLMNQEKYEKYLMETKNYTDYILKQNDSINKHLLMYNDIMK